MTRILKTEALVLRKRSLMGKDNLITLFTKELGKINVFGKGIKKITSRRLPHVQTANLINVVVSQKDDRFYLQETTLISAFSQIKKDNKKIQSLYFLFFILERLLPENQKEDEVYRNTISYLVRSSRNDELNEQLLDKSINKILKLLGYLKEKKSLEEVAYLVEEIIHEKFPKLHL